MRITAYGCVGDWAQSLGETAASGLLDKTLEEEKETDRGRKKLAQKSTRSQGLGQEQELSSTVQVAGCYEQIQALSYFMPPIIRVFSAFQR